jgi:hypothetical protein
MWIYKNKEFTSEMIGDNIGFVYLIENTIDSKKYIGKKNFYSKIKKAPLKGKKRKRTFINESDWLDYQSSSNILKEKISELGVDKFKFEILHLCKSKSQLSYMELKEQILRGSIESDDYYNEWISVKIHKVKNLSIST